MTKWADGPVTLENSDHAYYGIPEMGYLRWREYTGGQTVVYVHQLVAIAHGIATPEEAFSGGDFHVHHKDICTLNNAPENLEKESGREHGPNHMNGNYERDLYPQD